MMMTDKQFENLPKYAQFEMAHLYRKVGELNTIISEMNGECPDPIAWTGYDNEYSGDRRRGVLWEGEAVTFQTSSGQIEVMIDRDSGDLSIRGNRGRIAVKPEVSNVIRVECISTF